MKFKVEWYATVTICLDIEAEDEEDAHKKMHGMDTPLSIDPDLVRSLLPQGDEIFENIWDYELMDTEE